MDQTVPLADLPKAQQIPDAIQWHEGMLLAPQHFQQSALRTETLLNYQMHLAAPFHWGIRQLDIEEIALAGGLFRLKQLEAVMPDGLLVYHTASTGQHLSIALDQDALRTTPRLIHLAVAASPTGGAGVQGELARYLSCEGPTIVDDNTGTGELSIPRLRPRLQLFVGETPPAKYVSFPLAQVSYSDGTFIVTDYIPPLLAVAPSSPLARRGEQIAKHLREKAHFLAERARSPAAMEDRSLSAEGERRIGILTRGLPGFEAVLFSGAAHPFALYVALCALAGQVAGIGRTTLPPVFKPYNHNDLSATFEPVFTFIDQMLAQVHEAYSILHFMYAEGLFSLRLPAGITRLIVRLRARRGVSEQDLVTWLNSSLIGSASRLPSLRERRVLGAARQSVDRDETLDIVPPVGTMLFAIEPDPEFITPEETLTIYNPIFQDKRPAEIVLYVPEFTPEANR